MSDPAVAESGGNRDRTAWEWRVGLRYIRARTSNRFVSFISSISILGVALGVAVLIVVLSVMNGFESELRTRILSMTSHASLIGYDNGMEDWQAARDLIEADPRIRGAAPFVEGEGSVAACFPKLRCHGARCRSG